MIRKLLFSEKHTLQGFRDRLYCIRNSQISCAYCQYFQSILDFPLTSDEEYLALLELADRFCCNKQALNEMLL